MVGHGVLRECLLDQGVEGVLAIGRGATGQSHAKLRDLVLKDPGDLSGVQELVAGFDACFFCLGVTSVGMTEEAYTRITRDIAVRAAETLVRLKPGMTFVFVSGAGSDSSEQGRVMWARVKGKAENALLKLPFKAVYVFRPAFIQPLHGIRSKTRLYNVAYLLTAPLLPGLKALFPNYITTTEQVGQAMLGVVRHGATVRVLESKDINRVRPG
jgi:uncharacterized protein YbjT (DUF2867 family)